MAYSKSNCFAGVFVLVWPERARTRRRPSTPGTAGARRDVGGGTGGSGGAATGTAIAGALDG